MARFLYAAALVALLPLALAKLDPLQALLRDVEREDNGDVREVVPDEREEPYQQLLHELQRRLAYENQQEAAEALDKRAFECKNLGEGCRGLPKCCGSTQCYWSEGYNMFKAGVCVTCVQGEQQCQRDSQCCEGLMCDKGNALWVDGRCRAPRAQGDCYRQKQCSGTCSKSWWQIHGTCTV